MVVFDTNVRKFVREIPLPLREHEEGILKFGWLIDDLPTGRASMALVTEQSQYGQKKASSIVRILSSTHSVFSSSFGRCE